MIAKTNCISSWKSNKLLDETIKPPATSDNSLTPELSYYGTKTRVKFSRRCSKQATLSYTHKNVVNIYTVYELGGSSSDSDNPTRGIFWCSYFV